MSDPTTDEPSEQFFDDIRKLAEELNKVYAMAEREYTPMVDHLIRSKCEDQREIERLLDYLLGCACYDPILVLFKRLCRYYYALNPEAVASYVNAYREMLEEEEGDSATPS